MKRQLIIEKTIKVINQLPEDKAQEISDFADFVIKKFQENRITDEMQQITSNSKVFEFLNNEEDSYTLSDLKVKFDV